MEDAIAQRHAPFVICDDELFASAGDQLRPALLRLRQTAHCILLSNPATAVEQDEETLDLFENVLLKPVKQSHLFDTLVTAIEGRNPQTSRMKGGTDYYRGRDKNEERRRLSQLRILLAEDHHINRKLCLLMLEELGAKADVAVNGLEVLAALAEKDYDLILMDCNMPEMDGYEATKSIREQEASPLNVKRRRNRIIALTANALIGERERCLAVGMDDYLAKPFTASELRTMLERSIGWKSAAPETAPAPSRLDQLAAELDRESVEMMVRDYIVDLPLRLTEMEELAGAAISALRTQDDPAYVGPLQEMLQQRQADLPTRVFASGLGTLAYLARNEEKKTSVRDFLVRYLNDPRKTVQRSAMAALGTLGDPQAIVALEPFATAAKESPEQSAAEAAVTALRADRRPVDDFKNLRAEVLELQKANRNLRADLEDIKNQLAVRAVASPLPPKKSFSSRKNP